MFLLFLRSLHTPFKMMKTIEIVSFTGDSGLTDYSLSLAKELSKMANVSFITANSISKSFDNLGFPIKKLFRRSRHYPVDIVKFLLNGIKTRSDWLILQGPLKLAFIDGLVIRFLRVFGIKTCITVHDVLPHYPRPWSRFTYGFYYRSFDKAIVHSAAAAEGIKQLGVKAPVLIVPHGIYDIFDLTGIPQHQARLKLKNIRPDDFVILFFGHLETRKGLMEFLDVSEKLKSNYPNIKFLIAGGSSLAKQGSQYVERLNHAKFSENVIVYDERIPFEEVENYFSASDLVALPYLEGTTSGVLKLALAFGKPVVATRVGDFPEQIPEGAGVVIELNNIVEDLGSAILEIQKEYPTYLNSMKEAKNLAQWSDIATKVENFLN